MDAITRQLASGNSVTATSYKLEVTTPDGQVLTTVDLNEVRQVTRQGATLRLIRSLGDITLEMASLDAAGQLQASLDAHVHGDTSAAGGAPPAATVGRDTVRWVTGCGGALFLGACVLVGILGALAGHLRGGSVDSGPYLSATRERQPSPGYAVTYVVRGTAGAGALRVTYQTGQGGAEQQDNLAATGWSTRVTLQRGDFAYIAVQNGANGGTVECTIIVNGRAFKHASSSGAAAISTCGGSVGP